MTLPIRALFTFLKLQLDSYGFALTFECKQMTAEFTTSILMWSSDLLLINKLSAQNRGSKIILHQRIINNSDIT